MITVQVMSRKHGHKQYLVEPEQKALKKQLSQIEELKEGHRPPHFLAVQMAGMEQPEMLTRKQLENAKLDNVEKILVYPIITAG